MKVDQDVMPSFRELEFMVRNWATERAIFEESDSIAQAAVTLEELSELIKALNYYFGYVCHDDHMGEIRALDDIKDAYGDILVTLIIGHTFLFEESLLHRLEEAYMVIKDRKGKMVNGKFRKEVPSESHSH
jgi:NTP pyrophosphatase (non-canonical NTP hydrolase)